MRKKSIFMQFVFLCLVTGVGKPIGIELPFRSMLARSCKMFHYGVVGSLSLFFNWELINTDFKRDELVENMPEVPNDVRLFIDVELHKLNIDPTKIAVLHNHYFCFDHRPDSDFACYKNSMLVSDVERLSGLIQKEKNGLLKEREQKILDNSREQIRYEALAIINNDYQRLKLIRFAIPWVVQAGCYIFIEKFLAKTSIVRAIDNQLDRSVLTFCAKELGKAYITTAGELALMILLQRFYTQHKNGMVKHRMVTALNQI